MAVSKFYDASLLETLRIVEMNWGDGDLLRGNIYVFCFLCNKYILSFLLQLILLLLLLLQVSLVSVECTKKQINGLHSLRRVRGGGERERYGDNDVVAQVYERSKGDCKGKCRD